MKKPKHSDALVTPDIAREALEAVLDQERRGNLVDKINDREAALASTLRMSIHLSTGRYARNCGRLTKVQARGWSSRCSCRPSSSTES